MRGIGCVVLLLRSLCLPYNYFGCLLSFSTFNGITLEFAFLCLSMALSADAFKLSVFDFLRRLPALKCETSFLFLLGWTALVIVLLSITSETADSLTLISCAVSISSDACVAGWYISGFLVCLGIVNL